MRPDAHPVYDFSGFRLDPRRRHLVRVADGESIAVTPKAFDALVLLVEHAGEVVARQTLSKALWPSTIVEENNLTQAIAQLRRLLGEGHIATVPGRGYQFVANVDRTTAEPEYPSAPPAPDAKQEDEALPRGRFAPVARDPACSVLHVRRSRGAHGSGDLARGPLRERA